GLGRPPRTTTRGISPPLPRRYFESTHGADYIVAVRSAQDPRRVLFLSDPQVRVSSLGGGDLQLGIFGLRPFDDLRALASEHGFGLHHRHGDPPWLRSGLPMPPAEEHHREYGAWRLILKHRDGSLEEAVAAVR